MQQRTNYLAPIFPNGWFSRVKFMVPLPLLLSIPHSHQSLHKKTMIIPLLSFLLSHLPIFPNGWFSRVKFLVPLPLLLSIPHFHQSLHKKTMISPLLFFFSYQHTYLWYLTQRNLGDSRTACLLSLCFLLIN
jgi:hypothetical protein